MAETDQTAAPEGQPKRNPRRTLTGVVTRDKMTKTRRVEIQRLVKHPRYSKYIKRRTVSYVHEENNETRTGDTGAIIETPPLSKPKNRRLVRGLKKAPGRPEPIHRGLQPQ